MLPMVEASLSGNLLRGKMTKSSFDKTAEGNLVGVLRRRAAPWCWDNPLHSCGTVGPVSLEGTQLTDTCGLGAQEPGGSTAGSM